MNPGVVSRDAGGRVRASLADSMRWFNGGTPVAITGNLAVRQSVPSKAIGGLGYDATGCLCVSEGGTPAGHVAGIAMTSTGVVCVTTAGVISKHVGGLPVDSLGRMCVSGLSSLDADVSAWQARVTTNGGTASAGTVAAVDTFVKAAKASGYWSKFLRINLFCGDQLAAALTPLLVGGGLATDSPVGGFVEADYSEALGIAGNGTTKYLRTGIMAGSMLVSNNTHLAVYNRAAGAAGAGTKIGAFNGSNFFRFSAPFSDGIFYSAAYEGGVGNGLLTVASGPPYGLCVSSRTAANSHAIYKGGVSIASAAVVAGSLTGINEIFVLANNGAGAPQLFDAQRVGGYSIGSGLTAADVTAYTTHMQAFQTALGRAV